MSVARRSTMQRRLSIVFFFFQAEDGIRDDLVTGVQTCALPIYGAAHCLDEEAARHARRVAAAFPGISHGFFKSSHRRRRSEERRVGKECRSRWSPYH